MNIIESITSDLIAGSITIQEVQHKLSAYLYSEANKMELAISGNQLDSAINALDNELELIIFTLKEENQVKSALVTLGKAQKLVSSGFTL